MRTCQCGGNITQSSLTNDRESWKCTSCGRYEVFTKPSANQHGTDPLTNAQALAALRAGAVKSETK